MPEAFLGISLLFFSGFFSGSIYLQNILISQIILCLSFLICGYFLWHGYFYYKHEEQNWSIGIYFSKIKNPFDFTKNKINNPVLTKEDVLDVKADFVADPFLMKKGGDYYLFFEVFNSKKIKGEIGLAKSKDCLKWDYDKVILSEKFHLSYPHVFKYKDEYYMIPETHTKKSVRLYKADNFPYDWKFVKTILCGKNFMDSTIFFNENKWWLFTETNKNKELRLYYSEDIFGNWVEHSQSPINKNPSFSRPGGNILLHGKRLIRFAQDSIPYYGSQLWAFEILQLNEKKYKEKLIGKKPILRGFEDWNKKGMHHASYLQLTKDKFLIAVDGNNFI